MTPAQTIALASAGAAVAVSGVWLTVRGRPFSTAILTVHKLVPLVVAVYLGVQVFRAPATYLGSGGWPAWAAAAVLFVAAFATGGVVSAMESPPSWAIWVHRVGSWVALAAVGLAAR